jgi:hypothetical protein
MPTAARRIIVYALAGVALVLVASPDFTALERTVSKLFLADLDVAVPAVPPTTPQLDPLTSAVTAPAPAADLRAPAVATRSEGGRALLPLYLSFVALQGLDVHSTLIATRRGARETNPMMGAFVDRPAALVALKVGTAAGVLYMTERVRRHSPLGAVLMMVAFNSAYATVVANNYRVIGQLDR